jgi:MSHA biogenesis protein MshJ
MKQFQELLRKVDALSIRERVILFVLMLAGIWATMDALLLAPQDRARKAEQNKVAQAREQLLQAEQVLTARANQPDPARDARQRLENARRNLAAHMQTAAGLQAGMVAPKDMVRVVRDMLGGHPGLRLDSLDTLAPEPVTAAGSGPVSGVKTASDTGLFKHGVRLTLVGDYDALTRYMEKLERLPVRFYWDRAELDAAAHPDIRLTLILYTLSLERTWLTV